MTTAPLLTRAAYLDAVEKAQAAAQAYYQDASLLIGDDEYDALVRAIVATETTNPTWKVANTLTAVAAGTGGGDILHSAPMLSLDNVFSDEELNEWAEGLTRRLGRTPSSFTIEPKMDGLAICARYTGGVLTQLLRRGDGSAGEDVTFAARTIVGLPAKLDQPLTFEVRGEVLLTDDQFEHANELRLKHGDKPFVNPRNGAAGTLQGSKDRPYVIGLSFYAYGVVDLAGETFSADEPHSISMAKLDKLGISTTGASSAGMGQVSDIKEAHAWIDSLIARRPNLGFGIDGAVIKADSPADRADAGFSSRAPRWGIARKFAADTGLSVLRQIHWQLGRTGLITPRAEIDPVAVGGTIITYATLHSPGDIQKKGFMLGDTVTVLRAGEVIPRLSAPVVDRRDGTQVEIVPPAICPQCQSDIDRSQERWRCVRGRLCGMSQAVSYSLARSAWDADGFGQKIVDQLIEKGLVSDVSDVFYLTRPQLLGLERMGTLTVDKLLAQLDAAKSAPLARTITALGIRGTGRSMSRRLAQHFGSMAAFRAADLGVLQAVEGIGPEKAALIVQELKELSEVIDKLERAGVTMSDAVADAETVEAAPRELPFAGMNVCVSGTVPGLGRDAANEAVEALGGKSTGSVSRKTTLLVTGDGAGAKADRARELGIKVMKATDFATLVAKHTA